MQTGLLMKSALVFRAIAVFFSILILGIMVTQVFSRYVLESPIMWAEEFARFSYVWMVFLASVFVTAEQSHVTVTLADHLLTDRARGLIDGVITLLVAATSFAVAGGSFTWLQDVAGGSSAALGMPSEIYYGIVWFCFVMMGIYATIRGLLMLTGKQETPPVSEVEQALEEGV